MTPQVAEEPSVGVPSLRLQGIVIIEDASLKVPEHCANSGELFQPVWIARTRMTQSELRALCRRPSAQSTQSHRNTAQTRTGCSTRCGGMWRRSCGVCLEQVSAQSRSRAACQKKPRSIEELGGSWRLEHSSFFDTVRSRSGECSTVNGTGDERILRLICFRFDVGHISLPLGAKNLEAYSNERERTAPEERGGWRRRCCSVNVRRARGCTCCWLQTTSVHWSERAQQWRSRASCWRGHWRVLVLRWTYLKCRKMKKCGGPSLMTEVVLVKKRYVPVEAVEAPEMPNFATAHVLGLRRSTALLGYVSFTTQNSETGRLYVTDSMSESTSVADESPGRPIDTMLKGCLARGSDTWLLIRPQSWCMPDLKATKS